jgi:hypothetical protein
MPLIIKGFFRLIVPLDAIAGKSGHFRLLVCAPSNRAASLSSLVRLAFRVWTAACFVVVHPNSATDAWPCLAVQIIYVLLAIAMVHIDNRRASAIAMGYLRLAFAVSVLLIAAHDRPFTGQISVVPDPLLQLLSGRNSG